MEFGEAVAWIATLLLALYGCAQLIRRLCLWMARCPRCAQCYRLAVPGEGAAPEPLLRCLQAQAVWGETDGCRRTLLVLPENEELPENLLAETGTVIPVTVPQLVALITDQKE